MTANVRHVPRTPETPRLVFRLSHSHPGYSLAVVHFLAHSLAQSLQTTCKHLPYDVPETSKVCFHAACHERVSAVAVHGDGGQCPRTSGSSTGLRGVFGSAGPNKSAPSPYMMMAGRTSSTGLQGVFGSAGPNKSAPSPYMMMAGRTSSTGLQGVFGSAGPNESAPSPYMVMAGSALGPPQQDYGAF
ncbi:hypothetical protein FB451DRAFT_1171222 [Mycena latifolia]|nr:hypothetical protein FB451DRAFT_1171222 [Mycena latifolia]